MSHLDKLSMTFKISKFLNQYLEIRMEDHHALLH